MTISGFTIVTNALRDGYPILECLRAAIPMFDEIVVVDGGATDGTPEAIRALPTRKIRVVRDADTQWEEDWLYWRMGHNLDRGFRECTGDFAVKFDADYVFDNDYNLHGDFEVAERKGVLTVAVVRMNFILGDRFFFKSPKTLAVNKKRCRELGLDVRWGYDLKATGLGDEPVVYGNSEHGVNLGELLAKRSRRYFTDMAVCNYGYVFRTAPEARRMFCRNMRAYWGQLKLMGMAASVPSDDEHWRCYVETCLHSLASKQQHPIPLERHPFEIRQRIAELTPEQQGYDFFGKAKK